MIFDLILKKSRWRTLHLKLGIRDYVKSLNVIFDPILKKNQDGGFKMADFFIYEQICLKLGRKCLMLLRLIFLLKLTRFKWPIQNAILSLKLKLIEAVKITEYKNL